MDTSKSHIAFSVNWSGQPLRGEFKSWKADIDFDAADLTHARADVTINTTSATTGDGEIDSALQGALGLGTSDFPSARFQTAKIAGKGQNRYEAAGQLTLKGITKSLTLPFTLTLNGDSAHMVGTTHLIRTDFNVGGGEYASEKTVSHDVTVSIDLTAAKVH
ncbi:MAG: YceI family protein [Proteobacteria bacterium]|nr:YceI family protein [Pseudomonadota bacterium]